jgi:chromosome segregation ATPase
MDPTKSLLRSIKDTISRNNDMLDEWNAERGIRTERMDMKDEIATLRAENEQLRRERDAIRNGTIEEAATIADMHSHRGEIGAAIRKLRKKPARAALGNGGGDA